MLVYVARWKRIAIRLN